MKIKKLLVQVALAGMCSAAAQAQVNYTIVNSTADLETFDVTIDTKTTSGALAGGIQIHENGGPVAGVPVNYVTVCTDIQGTLYLGNSYNYATPVSLFSGQSGIGPTWGADNGPGVKLNNQTSADAAIQNAAYLFYTYGGLTSGGMSGTAEHMAALQLAIWDVLYNTGANGKVTGARFSFGNGDASAIADATAWIAGLASLSNEGNFGYTGFLLAPTPAGSTQGNGDAEPPQELLFAPVPEPSTFVAGALLLLPFGAAALRVMRKSFLA